MVYSASSARTLLENQGDGTAYLIKYVAYGALGLLAMFLVARQGLESPQIYATITRNKYRATPGRPAPRRWGCGERSSPVVRGWAAAVSTIRVGEVSAYPALRRHLRGSTEDRA